MDWIASLFHGLRLKVVEPNLLIIYVFIRLLPQNPLGLPGPIQIVESLSATLQVTMRHHNIFLLVYWELLQSRSHDFVNETVRLGTAKPDMRLIGIDWFVVDFVAEVLGLLPMEEGKRRFHLSRDCLECWLDIYSRAVHDLDRFGRGGLDGHRVDIHLQVLSVLRKTLRPLGRH